MTKTAKGKAKNILFDKSASDYMISIFKDKFPLTCIACGKEVNEKNLGGIVEKGFIHNNMVCLIQMQEKYPPPETGRGWESGDPFWSDLKRNYPSTYKTVVSRVNHLLASALAQGEKIGGEKERERIRTKIVAYAIEGRFDADEIKGLSLYSKIIRYFDALKG